jgi:hypothetical protein
MPNNALEPSVKYRGPRLSAARSSWPGSTRSLGVMRETVVAMLVLPCCLSVAGCDTLHGIRIEASPTSRTCVVAGLSGAGFALRDPSTSTGHAEVVEKESRVSWFTADLSNPNRVELYSLVMHEPMRCDRFANIVPRMRAAVKSIESSCATEHVLVTEHFMNQERCGM